MCTLAVYFQLSGRTPLIVAANRDEFYDRPSLPPHVISKKPRIWGGLDLRSGGTWLGLNEHGMVVGILNRRAGHADPTKRSRGLLCLDLLKLRCTKEAKEYLGKERPGAYNPFNLICAEPDNAFVAYSSGNEGLLRFESVCPGLHLITNLDIDDPFCPKISGSYRAFESMISLLDQNIPAELACSIRLLLAHHDIQLDDRGPRAPLCLHNASFGTRSSAIVSLTMPPKKYSYFYCDTAPCQGTMQELSIVGSR